MQSENRVVMCFHVLNSRVVVWNTTIHLCQIKYVKNQLSLALKESDKNLDEGKQTSYMHYFQVVIG